MRKILVLLIFVYACNQKEKTFPDSPMNHGFVEKYNDSILMYKLSNKVILEGDTVAFKELRHIYMISEHSEELLYFSTVMAEKYNYKVAYQTNYYILSDSPYIVLQKVALYNLLKSYELGNKSDLHTLQKKFPQGIPKSEDYLKELGGK